jgi:MFS family permease
MSSRFASYFGGIGQVLSVRDYRLYWLGQLVSVQGVWIQRIAAGVLIYDLTLSPGWLGFISFVYTVPLMVLGPFTGAFADRFGHRRTAIVGLLVGSVLSLAIAVLTFGGLMTPWLLAILIAAMGAQHAFDFPARQVLIQILVGREHMSAAIAVNSTTFNAAAFTGPALAAGLLAFGKVHFGAAGPALGFVVYTLVSLWFATSLFMIHARDAPRQASTFGKLLSDVREGFVYIWGHQTILTISGVWIVAGFVIRSYVDLMPGYAESVFHTDETGLGILLAASGAGALALSIVMAVRGRSEGLPRLFIVAMVVTTLSLIVFTATLNFWVATAAMAVVGGFSVASSICAQTLIQSTVAQAMRARVIAVYLSLVIGAQSLGALSLGWIAEFVGLRWSVGGGAALILLFVVLAGPAIWRRAAAIETEALGAGQAAMPRDDKPRKAAE